MLIFEIISLRKKSICLVMGKSNSLFNSFRAEIFHLDLYIILYIYPIIANEKHPHNVSIKHISIP